MTDNRTHILGIRLTPAELLAVKIEAALANRKPSDWARMILLAKVAGK